MHLALNSSESSNLSYNMDFTNSIVLLGMTKLGSSTAITIFYRIASVDQIQHDFDNNKFYASYLCVQRKDANSQTFSNIF